jgi:2-dehydro-3-deoxyphosphogluconate aldolase/(4S)-4-hydroxy-2-oxoglutarate aldolase
MSAPTREADGDATGDAIRAIKQAGIVAMIRGDFPIARAVAISAALVDESVCVIEVALNSRDALEAVAELRQVLGDRALVGAGTVRTPADLERALEAGAQFAVAPAFSTEAVALARELGVLYVPGVLTPTEAMLAHEAGCRMLKLFPTDVLGPAYLQAMRAPLNDLQFVPTGGVNAGNIAAYAQAGAAAVGVGSALIAGPDQPLEDLRRRARALRQGWQEAR